MRYRSVTRGFSMIEMLIVLAIMALILSVGVPYVLTAMNNATETVVIREVQTIFQAQVQYLSQYGGYAATLKALGPPGGGASGPEAARLIPASLASGEKDGYVFTMERTPGGFVVNAKPAVFGKTGRRTFYTDENGVVHQNWGEAPATAASPEIK